MWFFTGVFDWFTWKRSEFLGIVLYGKIMHENKFSDLNELHGKGEN